MDDWGCWKESLLLQVWKAGQRVLACWYKSLPKEPLSSVEP
eukprot:CAMPEP_0194189148 /NCGR_PEP_ID=MMETSP0154-20130528/57771_1 /TAXON_ID=1049557 /ORGANISM="Thalassiothrix antarctica, Strain L6-D1" /LENGTH=40 /DNA_ID= /DNA_START= /DNA_END= /DNA_ORIENTATION=